jgi:ABC-type transport system involved in multi-copper enzyme maturation permease subunit
MSSPDTWLQRLTRPFIENYPAQLALEFVAGAALGAEGLALLWWHSSLSVPVQVLLWFQFIATAATLRWAGFFPLFGPVLVYDLVRTARRSRYFYARIVYASILGIMLFWGFLMEYVEADRHGGLHNNDLARFSSGFFYVFMFVQFGLVALLTPAYTAGAIADEKKRRTLPYLLATDLRDREIVLGKLLSRLLNLTLFILTGLPILSLLQFIGGVDPGLLLAGFAATGLTMLGLAGLGMLNSVLARRPTDAIVMTYIEAFAYLALSGASWLLTLPAGWATFPSFGNWVSPITLQDVVEWFNTGNLISVLVQIYADLSSGGRLDQTVPKLLRNYALFHGILSFLCIAAAALRIRARALKEADYVPGRARRFLAELRPRIGQWPVLWKELFVERGFRLHWAARIFVGLLILASFLPVVFIIADYLRQRAGGFGFRGAWSPWQMFQEEINVWVRFMTAAIGMLMLIGVAVRAAVSISGERDNHTLDELLATPLGSDSILAGKWIGSLLSVRWAWLWMAVIWGMAVVVGALHPLALPVLLGEWFVYAAFVANLGLWFSMGSRTTLRAIVGTLLSTIALFGGHWLIWLLFVPFVMGRWPPMFEVIAKAQCGVTPPFALWMSGFMLDEANHGPFRREWAEMLAYSVFGVLFWLVAAAILWGVNSARFRDLTHRSVYSRYRMVRPGPRSSRPRLSPSGASTNGYAGWDIVDAVPADAEDEPAADALPTDEP